MILYEASKRISDVNQSLTWNIEEGAREQPFGAISWERSGMKNSVTQPVMSMLAGCWTAQAIDLHFVYDRLD